MNATMAEWQRAAGNRQGGGGSNRNPTDLVAPRRWDHLSYVSDSASRMGRDRQNGGVICYVNGMGILAANGYDMADNSYRR